MRHLGFGEFRLDEPARQLYRADERVPLSGKVFDLLQYMVENPNRLLAKQELMQAIWPDSFVEEANLSQNIFVLRKALGESGSSLIVTLPGRGYQFAAVVTELPRLPENAPQTVVQTVETTETRIVFEEDTEEHLPFWRSPVTLGFAAAALLLLGIAGWLGWERYEDRVGGPPVQVVVADPDGTTGDPVLDRTLVSVLRIEMAQSPFVTVVPVSKMRATMTLMTHKPDDPITGDVARELCERSDSQAVLHLAVARAGSHYVLSGEASNCADGTTLATAKRDVSRVDDLPDAISKTGASIRHSLGESRRMIARFNQPLVPAKTGSLEALKDFSQAGDLGQHGHFRESLELLKQAVALDPHFTMAYVNLGVISGNMGDFNGAKQYVQKAYDERDEATEPIKLFATAFYHQEITGDLDESVRNYKAWIQIYPRQAQPWGGLVESYRQMGDYPDAVDAAKHTLELMPTQVIPYYGLANAQMRNGDLPGALATCRLALSRKLDGEPLRLTLLLLAHLIHDPALLAEQDAWLKQHPDSPLFVINEASFAQDEGRMKAAQVLFDQVWDICKRQGSPAMATRFMLATSSSWVELGEPERARAILASAPPEDDFDDLLTLSYLGSSDKAAAMLHNYLASHPQSTIWNQRYAPLLRGEFALQAHKPQDAVTLMAPSRRCDGASLDGYYLRGMADIQAHQFPAAEAEFRSLLAHPYAEPSSASLPVAHLQLGRVLAQEGNKAAAADEYRTFLSLWKNADPDQPLLKQAKMELQSLSTAART